MCLCTLARLIARLFALGAVGSSLSLSSVSLAQRRTPIFPHEMSVQREVGDLAKALRCDDDAYAEGRTTSDPAMAGELTCSEEEEEEEEGLDLTVAANDAPPPPEPAQPKEALPEAAGANLAPVGGGGTASHCEAGDNDNEHSDDKDGKLDGSTSIKTVAEEAAAAEAAATAAVSLLADGDDDEEEEEEEDLT